MVQEKAGCPKGLKRGRGNDPETMEFAEQDGSDRDPSGRIVEVVGARRARVLADDETTNAVRTPIGCHSELVPGVGTVTAAGHH
jgi:hypothetical protein